MPLSPHMLPAAATIAVLILAGMLKVSAWALVGGACALALVSLTSRAGAFALHIYPGSRIALPAVMLSTAINSTAAAVASYILGGVIGWAAGI
jgi:hypothetical protein